eukprot:scaffold70275_cov63-Phaeocystis_antarctica.AAC.1
MGEKTAAAAGVVIVVVFEFQARNIWDLQAKNVWTQHTARLTSPPRNTLERLARLCDSAFLTLSGRRGLPTAALHRRWLAVATGGWARGHHVAQELAATKVE